MYCKNCGKKGHKFSKCNYPIISLGIICIKSNYNINKLLKDKKIKNISDISIKYLLICRKHSIGYVELIRGKYNENNFNYIYKLFQLITKKELLKIKKLDFDFLWNDLWNKKSIKFIKFYNNSKKKFLSLIKSEKFNYIINNLNPKWNEPEWEFPKGRRKIKETDIECAKREFSEETDLKPENYELINLDTITENHFGINKVKYRFIYYLAQSDSKLKLNKNNFHQTIEISNIKWFSYNDALKKIRNYQTQKINLLKLIHETLINLKK